MSQSLLAPIVEVRASIAANSVRHRVVNADCILCHLYCCDRSGSELRRWELVRQSGTASREIDLACRERRGKGARIASAHGGSTRLAVSAARELRDSVLSCGFTKDAETVKRGAETLPVLAGRVSKMRITGSAALDLAYVACGRFDAYFQYGIHLWDVAASSLLLEEAGGKWEILRELKPYCYDYMASNGTLQDELRPLITK